MSQQPSTNNYQLKVCGLTKMDQIQELISLNTNFLGFIFYEKSPRFVLNHLSLEEISEINHQGKVGVFVNETVEKIAEITEKLPEKARASKDAKIILAIAYYNADMEEKAQMIWGELKM